MVFGGSRVSTILLNIKSNKSFSVIRLGLHLNLCAMKICFCNLDVCIRNMKYVPMEIVFFCVKKYVNFRPNLRCTDVIHVHT